MAVTDPVDARLLAALAEVGKAAVHELAARLGMDPREVAYRLVNLSAAGLPLLVGVESDPNGLRAALANSPIHGPGGHAQPGQVHGTHSGAYPVQGTPSGAYQVRGMPSGAYPVQGAPSGPYAPPGVPAGHPAGPPAHPPKSPHPHPVPSPQAPQSPQPPQFPQPPQPPQPPQLAQPPDPAMSTWGPPQSALWARGDQRPAPSGGTPSARTGRAGDVLHTQGLEGEQLAIQLLEVQDPADFLFGAAGYRLEAGERAIVVHTEVTNEGKVPFASLPDNYLELITADGKAITKAPVSLTSRPPHKIGVAPGETSGGHTVYVVAEGLRVVSVRWSPRPEPDERSLTWSIET